jgi:hypothetical protein
MSTTELRDGVRASKGGYVSINYDQNATNLIRPTSARSSTSVPHRAHRVKRSSRSPAFAKSGVWSAIFRL